MTSKGFQTELTEERLGHRSSQCQWLPPGDGSRTAVTRSGFVFQVENAFY